MAAVDLAERFRIDVGTKVEYNGFEAVVVDKWLQEGLYVCEISYEESGDTDIVHMSSLNKVF